MQKFDDIEESIQSENGYSLKKCEPYWLVVYPTKEPGYRFVIVTVHTLFVDLDFGDEVAVFSYWEAVRYVREHNLAKHGAIVLNLADYWRLGNIPKLNPQHPTGKIVAGWPYNPLEEE